jgi:flavin-dependent dehydrogenase
MLDVIVVGARCAGAPTAMLLARRGYRVLVVDKGEFPSDTMSTLCIQPTGMSRLRRWGLVDRIRETHCPPIRAWTLAFDNVTLSGFPWSADGIAESYAPRRTVLDAILVDAAAAAGAEVRQAFSFEEPLFEDGVVVGIRGRTKAGTLVEERAKVVVGADGMRSRLAEAVGAAKIVERPTVSCGYYSLFSNVELSRMECYVRKHRGIAALPTHDGLSLVWAGRPRDDFHAYRADIAGGFLAILDEAAPDLARRVRAGKREERFLGTADLPHFIRKAQGPGWALVGDAAYYRDPMTAQGISDAFWSAELLADALDAGLSGRRHLAKALESYEQAHFEDALPRLEWTYRTADMRPLSANRLQLLEAVRADQKETNLFLGLNAGTVSPLVYFAPENVARILSAAAGRARESARRISAAPLSERSLA